MRFANRKSAGRELGNALREFVESNSIILALPRGGVVLGYEVAKILQSPLDVIMVRKIGHPASSEYAVGAIAEGSLPVYNEIELGLLDDEWREEAEKEARRLIAHRRKWYFNGAYAPPELTHKTVIFVDDGIATGLTMKAALAVVSNRHPAKIVIATPVASEEGIDMLQGDFDRIFVLDDPLNFLGSISLHFDDFPQVDDDEVKNLLERSLHYAIRKTITTHP